MMWAAMGPPVILTSISNHAVCRHGGIFHRPGQYSFFTPPDPPSDYAFEL